MFLVMEGLLALPPSPYVWPIASMNLDTCYRAPVITTRTIAMVQPGGPTPVATPTILALVVVSLATLDTLVFDMTMSTTLATPATQVPKVTIVQPQPQAPPHEALCPCHRHQLLCLP